MVYFVHPPSYSSAKSKIGVNSELPDFCAVSMLPHLSHPVRAPFCFKTEKLSQGPSALLDS